jgi:hypothetical protein
MLWCVSCGHKVEALVGYGHADTCPRLLRDESGHPVAVKDGSCNPWPPTPKNETMLGRPDPIERHLLAEFAWAAFNGDVRVGW